MTPNYFMRPYFYLALSHFFYIMLYAGSCTNSDKDKQPKLPHKHNAKQTDSKLSCTTEKPSLNQKEVPLNKETPGQYSELYTHSTNNNQGDSRSKAGNQSKLPHKHNVSQTESKLSCTTENSLLSQKEVPRTQKILDQVGNALITPPDMVLITINKMEIRSKDLAVLEGLNWLNDTIINSYMAMINNRSEDKENHLGLKVYAFNTFFYESLGEKGYSVLQPSST